MDFKTTPFAHQCECYELIKDKSYYALFLEPGLGKTKITLDTISYRKKSNRLYTTLVVCPNTIIENWLQEISIHSYLSGVILNGTRKRRLDRLSHENDIYIINYEGVSTVLKALEEKRFDLIVLDESQYVKGHTSNRSKACYYLAQGITDKFLLTGTPVTNNPLDLFAQYRILNPLIFGTNFFRFKYHYAIFGGFGNYQVIKWINMDKFKKKIFACAVRKTKEECLDLPEKLYQTIKVPMPPEQREVYDNLKLQFISEFKDSTILATAVLTRLIRFSQITAGFTKDVEGEEHAFKDNPKINWLIDFINNLEVRRKIVVFCRFVCEIKMVEEALRNNGTKYVSVYGAIKDRLEKINDFNRNEDIRVFVTNPETGGLGINLTAATYSIFMSNNYKFGDRIQAEDRIHRIGQDKNVTYIDVLMINSIDIAISRILKSKQKLADMVVGDVIRML